MISKNKNTKVRSLSRRQFLKEGAFAGGLVLSFSLPSHAQKMTAKLVGQEIKSEFAPNAFLVLKPDNSVTVFIKHLEMGQGVYTGLPTILAEELDADWKLVNVATAPADATRYNNLFFGTMQGTGGSTAIANSWDQLRQAGGMARAMLMQAAAKKFKVPVTELTTENSFVIHKKSDQRVAYGDLVEQAKTETPPAKVELKSNDKFKLIGSDLRRKDGVDKTNGKALFAMDVQLEGQLTALVLRPELFGAKVKTVNSAAALKIKGVREVLKVPQGVAVLADNYWAAKQGRDALVVTWDTSKAYKGSTADLRAQYTKLLSKKGAVAATRGSVQKNSNTARKVEAVYEFPYLAHAPMETLNCVVQFSRGKCTIWAGAQFQTIDQANTAKILGLKPQNVDIKTLVSGGSFGRRANFNSDYISEAAQIAKNSKFKNRPIHLVWTREDDIRGGYYRPMFMHKVTAGVDAKGLPQFWDQKIVGQSIMAGTPMAGMMIKGGVDHSSVEGASDMPYEFPNMNVELHSPQFAVPVLWWRSVGHTHTGFVTETMIDEMAHQAKEDPVKFRAKLLQKNPRELAVLERVAKESGWGKKMPKGKGLGVAVHKSFSSYVAQVVQVDMTGEDLKVEKVWCAVDCGVAVNPSTIKAQMEGGIGFALSAVLLGEITLNKGKVEQSNFHNFQTLRINQMPKVEVYIMKSAESPTGVGEPGVPPLGPALANAIFAATGKRLRKLPFRREELV